MSVSEHPAPGAAGVRAPYRDRPTLQKPFRRSNLREIFARVGARGVFVFNRYYTKGGSSWN
jgi:hypothetical protein